MALEFMKINGLTKILTSLDFKSYLIGVDKLPDYRNADYCQYLITEDATTRGGKLYYVKTAQAKGGFSYDVYSHFKLGFDDHYASMRPYEFNKLQTVAFRLEGTVEEEDYSGVFSFDNDGNVVELPITVEVPKKTSPEETPRVPPSINYITMDTDKKTYFYRNLETGAIDRLVCYTSGANTFIRAQGNFFNRTSTSQAINPNWETPDSLYYYTTDSKKFTVISGQKSSLAGSIAAYENARNCKVFMKIRGDTSTFLNLGVLYNCGWYLASATGPTIYNVDETLGAISENQLAQGAQLAPASMTATLDIMFVRGKRYFMAARATGLHATGREFNSGYEVIDTFDVENISWVFDNFVELQEGEDLDYKTGDSISEWIQTHGAVVYEDVSNYWIQRSNFLGILTRDHEWYERSARKFPYEGFIAIATSKYNGQQRGGFYRATEKKYQLTEDDVHHFRWTDDTHTTAKSKVYYEWHTDTNQYIGRNGTPPVEGSGEDVVSGYIYRNLDGNSFFQKPEETTYQENKVYYANQTGSEVKTGYNVGDPIPDGVYVSDRDVFYRYSDNQWHIEKILDKFGITSDLTPSVLSGSKAQKYYFNNGGTSFTEIPSGDMFTITTDLVVSGSDSKQYFIVTESSKANPAFANKFEQLTKGPYVGMEVSRVPYTLYERGTAGEMPTEIPIYVKFDKYTYNDGSVRFDGYTIPDTIDIITKSMNGEAILPDVYYERCIGMYVWEQYFIERGVSVTKPYDVTAIYVTSGTGTDTVYTLYLMWKDPKFMLHKDDPTASPDAWARTDVTIKYTSDVYHEQRELRLLTEAAVNDVYAEEFFAMSSNVAVESSGLSIDPTEFINAVTKGTITISAVANTGISSEYSIRPSKVVWLNSTKGYTQINGGTAVPGAKYYTINSEGKEVEVADVVPYVADVSKYYIKYQKDIEMYEKDGTTYTLITVENEGTTGSHAEGTKVEGVTLYTRVTTDPEITMQEVIRAGLFDKLFSHGEYTNMFVLTEDTTFASGKTYYTIVNGEFTAATVTIGNPVPANTYYERISVSPGTILGSAPIRSNTGTGYGNCNVTVVDVDGASLGYNIERGFDDVLDVYSLTTDATFEEGKSYYIKNGMYYDNAIVDVGDPVTANTYYERAEVDSMMLSDPDEVTYFARRNVTKRTCSDGSKDNNNVYYDLVPVVSGSALYETIKNYILNGTPWTTKGMLFVRTNPNPHYNHFINTRNKRASDSRFVLRTTYSIRKNSEVNFVTLNPNYRSPNTSAPDVYNTRYFYYVGDLLDGDPHPGVVFDDPNAIDPLTGELDPIARHLWDKVRTVGEYWNWKYPTIYTSTYSSTFVPASGYVYESKPDPTGKINKWNNSTHTFEECYVYSSTDDFEATWKQDTSPTSSTLGRWAFTGWVFKNIRPYYIFYPNTGDTKETGKTYPTGGHDYTIGTIVANWTSANDGKNVFQEVKGVSSYLDVTSFGMDALRGCTVPLYVRDKATVIPQGKTEPEEVEVYTALSRPAHSATFRYSEPLSTTKKIGTGKYWDDSEVRTYLLNFGTPDASAKGSASDAEARFRDYMEFYENHIIPVVSTVFRDWNGEKYNISQVFDKFWLPCIGNFVQDSFLDTVNEDTPVDGVPSEDGALDLYSKGIGYANTVDAVEFARIIRNADGTPVSWLLRTCPSVTGTPVVITVGPDGSLISTSKAVAGNLVPHFTIA